MMPGRSESRKLTRDFAGRQVKIGVYPSTGKRVHLMNHHRLDKLYDFEHAKDRTVTVEFLCNQIIHSYVFALFFDETNNFHSIAVASDRAKVKELFSPSHYDRRLFRTRWQGRRRRHAHLPV